MKPHIYTICMEAMLAVWQQPPLLVLLELTQTDGAFHPLLPAGAGLRRRENDYRQRPYRSLVEPPRMGRHRSTLRDIGTVGGDEDVQPQAGHTAADSSGLVAAVAEEAAAGVDMEADDDGDDDEEDADGGDHNSPGDDKARGVVT